MLRHGFIRDSSRSTDYFPVLRPTLLLTMSLRPDRPLTRLLSGLTWGAWRFKSRGGGLTMWMVHASGWFVKRRGSVGFHLGTSGRFNIAAATVGPGSCSS